MTNVGGDASLVKAEARRLRVEMQLVDAARVRSELAAAKIAEQDKTARLRALRLARDVAAEAVPKPVKKAVRKAKAASVG